MRLELAFIDVNNARLEDEVVARRQRGAGQTLVFPQGEAAAQLCKRLRTRNLDASVIESIDMAVAHKQSALDAQVDASAWPCLVLLERDPARLSEALIQLTRLRGGMVLAPQAEGFFRNKPLYLISIPKSGTHLVYELIAAFGYSLGGNSPDNPSGGVAYFIDSMNPHTPTSFLDFTNSSATLYHPFMQSAALFTYRNPLDIVISEANYYHRDGKSPMWSYLAKLSYEQRVRNLVSDPFLLGTIRDRLLPFVGWLDIGNVIPASYEELVGPQGGGDSARQTRLIWSIQLKLQVPGDPSKYATKIYSERTATFTTGRLGSHKTEMPKQALSEFLALPQDFMHRMGYGHFSSGGALTEKELPSPYSDRIEEFLDRPLCVSKADIYSKPILMRANFCGHNIVRYKNVFYALRQNVASLQLDALSPSDLALIPSDPDMTSLMQKVVPTYSSSLAHRIWRSIRSRYNE